MNNDAKINKLNEKNIEFDNDIKELTNKINIVIKSYEIISKNDKDID
jgi:hypothetical protein